MIVDAKGVPIHRETDSGLVVAELSKSELNRFREKFPVYMEGDRFQLI